MLEKLKELVSDFIDSLKKKKPAYVPVRNQQQGLRPERYRN